MSESIAETYNRPTHLESHFPRMLEVFLQSSSHCLNSLAISSLTFGSRT
jgi:hypothetical protein